MMRPKSVSSALSLGGFSRVRYIFVTSPLLLARVLPVAETAVGVHRAVQVDRVHGVDAALDGLRVVVLLEVPGDVTVAVRHARPLELGHRLHVLLRAHVRPEDAAALPDGVRPQLDLVPEVAVRGLGRHVDALAVDVELPAVVGAAEAHLLVAPEEEVRVAVRAETVDQSDLPDAVPERDEPLTQQGDTDGHAVGFGDVFGEKERDPVAAHQRAHLRSGTDAGQPFVIQCTQHGNLPLNVQRFSRYREIRTICRAGQPRGNPHPRPLSQRERGAREIPPLRCAPVGMTENPNDVRSSPGPCRCRVPRCA